MAFILRRRKLGATSCREISRLSTQGIVAVRNDNIRPITDGALVFRWGCTSNVPTNNIVNTAEAIHRVSDKRGFRILIDEQGLCPKTWGSFADFSQPRTGGDVGPWVVRPAVHAQGRHVILCNTVAEVRAACARFPQHYISKYIAKVCEYRVFVVSGRVVWVAKKTPGNPQDVAWNVARGGRFDNVRFDDWPLRSIKAAVAAFNLSGLDFGGVDVMEDAEGHAYVLEINSAPSQTSPYRQQCTARAFDYIVQNGKQHLAVDATRKGGHRKWGHPAIVPEAWR